jgi:hypothetical protein
VFRRRRDPGRGGLLSRQTAVIGVEY